jgi:hypothetical protein
MGTLMFSNAVGPEPAHHTDLLKLVSELFQPTGWAGFADASHAAGWANNFNLSHNPVTDHGFLIH